MNLDCKAILIVNYILIKRHKNLSIDIVTFQIIFIKHTCISVFQYETFRYKKLGLEYIYGLHQLFLEII